MRKSLKGELLKVSWKKTILMIFSYSFFLFCSFFYLSQLIDGYLMHTPLDAFDGSLRLLASLYTSQGFIPYSDFSFVYPPGLIILNSLIHMNISAHVHVLIGLATVFSLLLVVFFYYKTLNVFYTGIVILLLGITFHPISSPFTETLWIGFIWCLYCYLREKNVRYLWVIGVIATLFFLLRWERIVFLSVFLCVSLVLLWAFAKKFPEIRTIPLQRILIVLSVAIAAGSVISLLFWSMWGSDIIQTLYFIFIVPFKIGPYRKLPLLSTDLLFHGRIIYFYFFVLSLLYMKLFMTYLHKKLKAEDVINVIIPLSVLPYALNRVDVPHVLPLIVSTTFIVIYYALQKRRFFFFLLFPMLLFLFHSLVQPALIKNVAQLGEPQNISPIESTIAECREKVKSLQYKTIFTGRNDYSHYIYNYAILYLIDPMKKPATNYISEEPGLQTTCDDGNEIVSDLSKAERPLLSFIELSRQPYEPNASSQMKSCGRIESWLKEHKYTIIGYCTVDTAKFEIRQYK